MGALNPIELGAAGGVATILSAGRTGRIWGAVTGQVIYSEVIPANTILPAAHLSITGLLAKYSPNNGGWSFSVRFVQGANSVVVVQSAIAATMLNAPIDHEIILSGDRKWSFALSALRNVYGVSNGSYPSAGFVSPSVASTSAVPSTTSPRQQGSASGTNFVSYSAPPTVETTLIDFSQDVTVEVTVNVVANDSVEMLGLRIVQSGLSDAGVYSKSTWCLGDSLTEGTGSTTNNDWVSVLGRTRSGRGVLNYGLGGQTITQIVDRAVKDPICGKYWDMLFWGGINDVGSDGPTWWATVQAQLARLMAYRDASARHPLFLNFHESTAWTTAQKTAATYVNTQLAATYGANVVDIASVINGNSGYYSDAIHLNDSGYAAVASAVSTKMTAQGWAA